MSSKAKKVSKEVVGRRLETVLQELCYEGHADKKVWIETKDCSFSDSVIIEVVSDEIKIKV